MGDVTDRILIDAVPGETRLCFLSKGRLTGFSIDRATRTSQVDDLILGQVRRVVPKLRAAFVDVGASRDGFLPLDDDFTVHEGETVIVQVRRDAIVGQGEDKGPRLSAHITLPGDLAVLEPYGEGVSVSRKIDDPDLRDRLAEIAEEAMDGAEGHIMVRTEAAQKDEDELADEINALLDRWEEIEDAADNLDPPAVLASGRTMVMRMLNQARPDTAELIVSDAAIITQLGLPWSRLAKVERNDGPLFERYGVEEQIEALLSPRVDLPSGGHLIISETPALTAIDINLGGAEGGEDGFFDTNMEAAEEIARQMVLRNLGGQIVVDFLRQRESENRRRVWSHMDQESDRWTKVFGHSRMGLMEITRQRQGETLSSLLTADCEHCGGYHGRHSDTAAAFALMRAFHAARGGAFVAAPGVVDQLKGRLSDFRVELEQAVGQKLDVTANPDLAAGSFEAQS